eukprot:CAMPEP_0114357402 /NCGR_PEP_ID=MMETSP0101-20121206/21596_1 /TAXON_ID=38822 ORGANISM="Pteridomonas danica, Strain PT" /NCGR_SAMPLE_ID=MMETSP0101 /ASSEMBLY_ACC=CAM_ASM_000211 /LENGTH=37 /DNA_ID= /DNA_START= /DNA_END= /DNA_ORIENTATION=
MKMKMIFEDHQIVLHELQQTNSDDEEEDYHHDGVDVD